MLLLRLEVTVTYVFSPDRRYCFKTDSLASESLQRRLSACTGLILSGRLANVSARRVTVATVPTRTWWGAGGGRGAQHLDPSRKSRPGGQLPGFEVSASGFARTRVLDHCMFGVLGQQVKDHLHLPEEKGREETGKEKERE